MKVFLVDDEIATREGIRSSSLWDEGKYTLVGEAPDGEIALPMIYEEMPDIVITDIRMPFMDGLALSRAIKTSMPWIHIVILSGYSDFSYAKQAISLGVEEYLLKPVTVEELRGVLDRIGDKVREESRIRADANTLQNRMASGMRFVQDKLLQSIMYSPVGEEEARKTEEQMQNLGISLAADCYTVMEISCVFPNGDSEECFRVLLQLTDGSGGMILLCTFPGGVRALVKGSSREDVEERAYTFAQAGLYTLEQNHAEDILITIGEICTDLSEIYESMRSARHIRYLAMKKPENARMRIIGIQEIDDDPSALRNLDIQPLYEQLRYAPREEFPGVFQEYAYSLHGADVYTEGTREYLRMEGLMTAARIVREAGGEPGDVLDHQDYETVINPAPWEAVNSALTSLLMQALEYRDSKMPAYGNVAVVRAQQYLAHNFTNPNLMLQDAAKAAGMSNSRFSTVFSQETGMSFTNYLTGLRIAKAKELLCATDMRSSQICYAVGYNDRHYFSYIFKKNTGCTPSEYRNENKPKEAPVK